MTFAGLALVFAAQRRSDSVRDGAPGCRQALVHFEILWARLLSPPRLFHAVSSLRSHNAPLSFAGACGRGCHLVNIFLE